MKRYIVTFANGTVRNIEIYTEAPVSEEVAKWENEALSPENIVSAVEVENFPPTEGQ